MAGDDRRHNGVGPSLAPKSILLLPFSLDEQTLREAEAAALRFVNGPWSVPEASGPGGPGGPARSEARGDAPALAPLAGPAPGGAPGGVHGAPAALPSAPGRPAARELWSNMTEEEPSPPSAPAHSALEGNSSAEPGIRPPSAPAQPGPAGHPAPAGQPTTQGGPRSWANIVSRETDGPRAGAGAGARGTQEAPRKPQSIIDYLLFLAKNGPTEDSCEEFRKFKILLDPGIKTIQKSSHVRRGMRNDANNCYVNVVVQSLLPCNALMRLLSHCGSSDSERPFHTSMVRLCKEFHPKKTDTQPEPFNVILMPMVKDIISKWKSIGVQQDAGEFLFYMLNGMHEECKWNAAPPDLASATSGLVDAPADEDWAQVGKQNRKVEVRSAGVHEDSPIMRIFGGVVRSSLRAKNAKADSVSLEPFNHLILDISPPNVDSVWSALEVYCGAEAVNDGRATKRLHFKVMPKVLILNLKRFSYNKDTLCPQKIKKAVKFEEKLTFDRSWLVEHVDPPEYQLTAVICHHGDSANGGHYNAAVRYDSEWYMYDDALVRQMSLAEVMNQQFTAYLLLYQCHDKVDLRP